MGDGARVSVAQHNARAVVAPKLGIGAARRGHLIFIARSSLRRKARTGRNHGGVGAAMEVVTDPVTREEEEDRSNQWGPPVSVSGRDERCGCAAEWAPGEAAPLRGIGGRAGEAGPS